MRFDLSEAIGASLRTTVIRERETEGLDRESVVLRVVELLKGLGVTESVGMYVDPENFLPASKMSIARR